MKLLLFISPQRKHFRFAQNWGRLKWWLLVHMILGIGGLLPTPLLQKIGIQFDTKFGTA